MLNDMDSGSSSSQSQSLNASENGRAFGSVGKLPNTQLCSMKPYTQNRR